MSSSTCIIGAGASGIAAVKVLKERGLPFDCFEMGSDVGGLWRYDNETDRSPAYRSLRTNTSRTRTGFSDFPMPDTYPDFPDHEQMLAYLEAYVDRFGLRAHIRFRAKVERVAPLVGGGYEVTARSLETGETRTEEYASVIVASGHHWNPNMPDFSGSFDGLAMHSSDYRTPEVAEGKRVLVVGVGNSACDIVCEVARVADQAFQSTRRGAHVIPKYLLGRPLDLWLSPLSSRLPLSVRRALFRALIFLSQGRQRSYGFPVPDHPLGAEHPTISSDLLPLVREGSIVPKPDVAELQGGSVRFVDGSTEAVDVIIYATGYLMAFPFLDFLEARDNDLPLYRHVVHPDHPNLYFLGFVQPLGPLPPLSEAQAEWAADLIEGGAALPSRDSMWRAIEHDEEERRRRYVDSKRHRLEVDYFPYLWQLRRERELGRRRRSELSPARSEVPA